MTEILARDGTWTFDGEVVRIVPGQDKRVHKLRQSVGELAVPLAAVAAIAYHPSRKGGQVRLSLRDGTDPLSQVAQGRLPDAADPYRLTADPDRTGVAEYFADEVRNALLIDGVDGLAERYLLPGPRVPLAASAGDGTASFDGRLIRLEWNGWAEESKKSAGPQRIALADLASVEWSPVAGFENGYLRFRLKGATGGPPPKHDPNCITWGMRQLGGSTLLLAAAVTVRLPHPSGTSRPEPEPAAIPAGDHDALLRRLRELGDLHRDGVLTDEEFATAKRILLGGT